MNDLLERLREATERYRREKEAARQERVRLEDAIVAAHVTMLELEQAERRLR